MLLSISWVNTRFPRRGAYRELYVALFRLWKEAAPSAVVYPHSRREKFNHAKLGFDSLMPSFRERMDASGQMRLAIIRFDPSITTSFFCREVDVYVRTLVAR
jgi:hypothetical protein